MTYGAQYRITMAGLMDGADDDATLANEWQARLKMPGRERWMNEVTGARHHRFFPDTDVDGILPC